MNARTASAAASKRRAREPEQALRPLRRRVQPRRQDRAERERAVDVVELVGGPPVVGEEQQPEPDLGDEQRLREREQVRDEPPRPARRQ